MMPHVFEGELLIDIVLLTVNCMRFVLGSRIRIYLTCSEMSYEKKCIDIYLYYKNNLFKS